MTNLGCIKEHWFHESDFRNIDWRMMRLRKFQFLKWQKQHPRTTGLSWRMMHRGTNVTCNIQQKHSRTTGLGWWMMRKRTFLINHWSKQVLGEEPMHLHHDWKNWLIYLLHEATNKRALWMLLLHQSLGGIRKGWVLHQTQTSHRSRLSRIFENVQ